MSESAVNKINVLQLSSLEMTLAIGAIATHGFILSEVVFSEGDMIRPQRVVSAFTPARRRFASISPSSNVLRWVFGC